MTTGKQGADGAAAQSPKSRLRRWSLRRGSVLPLLLAASALGAQDFPLIQGSYLVTDPAEPIGIAINPSGAVVVGYNRLPAAGSPGATTGVIELRRPDTGALLGSIPLSRALRGLRGSVAAARPWIAWSDDSIWIPDANGATLATTLGPGQLGAAPDQVALCADRLVMLTGNRAQLRQLDGALIGEVTINGATLNDVACSNAPTQIIVTGFRQVSGNLQVAFVQAHQANGSEVWRSWGWSAQDLNGQNLGSDTRGLRLQFDHGRLLVAGSSAGGASIFLRDPQDLSTAAANVSFDVYNQTSNLGGPSIGYYAELDASSGQLLRGQFALTRLSSGQGNSLFIRDLLIDADGRWQIAGRAAASIANRTTQSVAGLPVGAYAGGDPYLLVASSDLSSRVHWSSFGASSGRGDVRSLASRDGRHALLMRSDQGSMLTPNGLIDASQLTFTPSNATPATWLGTWGVTAWPADALYADGFENDAAL